MRGARRLSLSSRTEAQNFVKRVTVLFGKQERTAKIDFLRIEFYFL